MKDKKTVVIVEDDPGLRQQLMLVLKSARDIECLYAVESGEEAVRRISAQPPDVVLMDIQLPGISGIECVAVLKKRLPDLEFIMLTVYEDADRIFSALKAGASGYLIKSGPPEKLFEAIRDVHSGGSQFSAHIARRVAQYFRSPPKQQEPSAEVDKLSSRELEVIELLASGYIYKEIADKLGIGTETVRTYVKNICSKLRVKNRTEAVAKHFS